MYIFRTSTRQHTHLVLISENEIIILKNQRIVLDKLSKYDNSLKCILTMFRVYCLTEQLDPYTCTNGNNLLVSSSHIGVNDRSRCTRWELMAYASACHKTRSMIGALIVTLYIIPTRML